VNVQRILEQVRHDKGHTRAVSVRLSEDVYAAIHEAAREAGVSMSALLRVLAEEFAREYRRKARTAKTAE